MNYIRVCADHLAILGDPVKPEDLIERVLEGLQDDQDSKYQAVIDATNARDSLISFDELHEKLLTKEVSIRTTPNPTPLPASVHATNTRNFPQTTPNQYQGQSESYSRNHSHQKQPVNNFKQNNHTKSGGYQGKCQWCHAHGHSLYRCPIFQQRFPTARPTLPPTSNNQMTPPQAHVATASNATPPTSWLLDTGSTHHVTQDMSNLSLHHPYDGTEEIVIGNGAGVPITHIGSLTLPTTSSKLIHLSNILCAPTMTRNIISISQLCADNNLLIEFSSDSFLMKDRLTGAQLIKGPTRQGVYEWPSPSSILALSTVKAPAINWNH